MEMRISEEKAAQLQDFQARAQQLVLEIGKLEVAKVRKIGELSVVENSSQVMIREIKEQFAIPDGTSWQVLPDGSIKIVGGDPPPPLPEA